MTTPRTVLITGAAQGIGAAIATRFAEAGDRVALVDLDADAATLHAASLRDAGHDAHAYACDVGREAEVERTLEATRSDLGAIDVLVNNAGIGGPFHRADEVSLEEWRRIFDTNLTSVFLFCRRILPEMKARGGGRVINVASIQGLVGAARSSTYVATKHGMIGYTRAIAAEWGPHGVTANAIAPGYVDTRLGAQDDAIPDHLRAIIERTPARRVAGPDEIAHLVHFVASPEARYINGATLVADGGITADVGVS